MNLLFLYGPPATGKLTVATEISKLIDYPVFHNHLTRDLVEDIFPGKLEKHYELVHIMRENVMEYCAQYNTSLLFTFVYASPDDDEIVSRMVNKVAENGGNVLFVELTAPSDVLLKRVNNESRKQYNKLRDPDHLDSLIKTNVFSSVPYKDVFKVDTSILTPIEAARLIVDHFNLI